MSTTAPQWFVDDYVEGVMQQYQDKGGRLVNTVRKKHINKSEKAVFFVQGTLEAYEHDGVGKLRRQGTEKSKVEVTPRRWKVTPVIEEFDLDRMQPDDRDEAQRAGGMAIARKVDDLIYAAATGTETGTVLGGADIFFSPDLNEQILEEMYEVRNVDEDENVFTIVNRRAWRHLMRFPDFKSSDYVGPDIPLIKNSKYARSWGGQHYILFPRMTVTDNLARCVSYAESVIAHTLLLAMTPLGYDSLSIVPRVARSLRSASQPWATRNNAFGVRKGC